MPKSYPRIQDKMAMEREISKKHTQKTNKNIQSILGPTVARLQKTALQETWDVRDIALAAGANLSDLVAWHHGSSQGL